MSHPAARRQFPLWFLMCTLLLWALPATAQTAVAPQHAAALVDAAVLAKLLPTLDGWTRGEVKPVRVDMSSEGTYTFASVVYTKDEWRLKLTLADTGGVDSTLLVLASTVVTFPEDTVQEIPPSTTITRMKVGDHQAAAMWDAAKLNGEIAVVVNGRFVALVEATKAENLDMLRTLLAAVNLKALAAAK